MPCTTVWCGHSQDTGIRTPTENLPHLKPSKQCQACAAHPYTQGGCTGHLWAWGRECASCPQVSLHPSILIGSSQLAWLNGPQPKWQPQAHRGTTTSSIVPRRSSAPAGAAPAPKALQALQGGAAEAASTVLDWATTVQRQGWALHPHLGPPTCCCIDSLNATWAPHLSWPKPCLPWHVAPSPSLSPPQWKAPPHRRHVRELKPGAAVIHYQTTFPGTAASTQLFASEPGAQLRLPPAQSCHAAPPTLWVPGTGQGGPWSRLYQHTGKQGCPASHWWWSGLCSQRLMATQWGREGWGVGNSLLSMSVWGLGWSCIRARAERSGLGTKVAQRWLWSVLNWAPCTNFMGSRSGGSNCCRTKLPAQ